MVPTASAAVAAEGGRPDRTVWVGTSKGVIRVYDPNTNTKIASLAAHTGGVYCMLQAAEFVYSGSNDFLVIEWDAATGTVARWICNHHCICHCILVCS